MWENKKSYTEKAERIEWLPTPARPGSSLFPRIRGHSEEISNLVFSTSGGGSCARSSPGPFSSFLLAIYKADNDRINSGCIRKGADSYLLFFGG